MTRSNAPGVVGLVVASVLVLGGSGAAAKTVRITKTADVVTKSFQVKKVTIDHPLGKLTIRGWDQRSVRITAVKIASSVETAARLRVHAELKDGRIDIKTRVLMEGQQPMDAAMSKRLLKIEAGLQELQRSAKPWSASTRSRMQRLIKQRNAIARAVVQRITPVTALRAVPLKGASLELSVFVPYGTPLEGKTLKGDIDAAKLRGPVKLSSQHGRIYARNVTGAVETRTDKGNQFISSIRGPVQVNAYDGDLRMRSVRGSRIMATLIRGQIVAVGLDAPLVRLTTTHGAVTVTATLSAAGKLEVRTFRGNIDVRLQPRVGFGMRLETRHGRLQLPRGARTSGPSPLRQRGKFRHGGGLVDLRSVYGNVSVR
ncbi:MAG: DUF4097 family beta strand repeat-containing protein [bacterium]